MSTPVCVISIGHPTTSEIAQFRITAQQAKANVQTHSVLVAIYKKITKKSNEGLTYFTWKRATMSPEVKHLLNIDGYDVTPVSGANAIGFVISW